MTNIMYHQIGNTSNSVGISLKKFQNQLNFFSKSTSRYILTFDHGTIDHYRHALPELNKRGLKGIFFILTMIQEDFKLPIEDKQRKLERKLKKKLPKIICEELGIKFNPIISKDFRKRFKFYSLEERYLRFLRDKVININDYKLIIDKLFNKIVGSEKDFIKKNYLNWAQIKKILDFGHQIGSHSHSHFGDLIDYKYSMNVIRKRLKVKIETISYPNGEKRISNNELKKLGIKEAYTTNLLSKNKYQLSRIDCNQFSY